MFHDALPKELMELQLGQIDLLQAMYASDDSVSMDETSSTLVEALRLWCESDEQMPPKLSQPSISLILSLNLPEEDTGHIERKFVLELEVSFPLVSEERPIEEDIMETPGFKIRARQPSWMSKGQTAALTDAIPDEDMLTALDYIKDTSCQLLQESLKKSAAPSPMDKDTSIDRIWFYFPSISTRSKRDDIVNYAPTYGLTGFLLAGKPGILCLEGLSQTIDDYMKFIKTESWSDIPSHHKKVSERYRETGREIQRAFEDMREITESLGERRGERANRNDMKALEAWLTQRGLGEAFEKILI